MQTTSTTTDSVRALEIGNRLLRASDVWIRPALVVPGAILALTVAIIHLQDQGGLLGHQSPTWLKFGYYLVEIGATVAAGLILRSKVVGWLLGLASTAGPLVGYLLSRTVGIPGDPGDVGNWGYTLGTVSLIVEGSFITVAVFVLRGLIRGGAAITLRRGPAATELSASTRQSFTA
jgi:hypothetical protein